MQDAPVLERRIGAAVAAAAMIWMFFVASWGLAGSYPDGHYASTAAMGTSAYNMWKYHIIFPVPINPLPPAPSMSSYYMHHPLGTFWVTALFMKVFGASNPVARLPPIVYSTLIPFFLYRMGRDVWGPLAGGLCALAYVALPITLGFANFNALENPVIFGLSIASWGYARFVRTWRDRYAIASALGVLFAVHNEWIAVVWAVLVGVWFFGRAFIVPSTWFGPAEPRPSARYFAVLVAATTLSLAVSLALVLDTNKLQDLFGSYTARSSGNAAPFKAVLALRHTWIYMMFPGAAILVGKLALPVIVGRLVVTRDEREGLPLPMLIMALYQYLHFKQGADIHIFWPHYFAPYFAMAVGALTAGLTSALAWLGPQLRGRLGAFVRAWPAVLAAGVMALPVLFVLQDGARTIHLARETGGRYVSPNIQSDIDKEDALRWILPRLAPLDRIGFHPGFQPVHWGLAWELRPHVLTSNQPVGDRRTQLDRLYMIDTRYAPAADLRQAAGAFHVYAVGHYWLIDRREPPTPLDGYRFDEHEPSLFESYIYGATEPIRRVVPDPFTTWEWRSLLGQPAPLPVGEPKTLEQLRIAHNVALAGGDAAKAARLREAVVARLSRRLSVRFDNGTELLGYYHHWGAERSVTLYFLAGDFKGARTKFDVHSRVAKPPIFSTLVRDPAEIPISPPPPVSTELWRPGHVYSVKVPYHKRPGTEHLTGAFVSIDGKPAPRALGRKVFVDITDI